MAPKPRFRRRIRRERLKCDDTSSEEGSDEGSDGSTEKPSLSTPADDSLDFGLEPGQFCGRDNCYRALCPIATGNTKTWLCLDERQGRDSFLEFASSNVDPKLVAVKECGVSKTSDQARVSVDFAKREVESLSKVGKGPGSDHVVRLLSHFWFESLHGRHFCRAYELLDVTLNDILYTFEPEKPPSNLVKKIAVDVLSGLGCLHSQNVRHGDVSASNILVDRQDWMFLKSSVIAVWRRLQQREPETKKGSCKRQSKDKAKERRKKIEDHKCDSTEFEELAGLSSTFEERLILDLGKCEQIRVKLIDLEGADTKRPGRAPEDILGMPSHLKGDCWSTACLLYQMTTGAHLFDLDRTDDVDDDDVPPAKSAAAKGKVSRDERHLKLMVQTLGSFPPNAWAHTGKRTHKFFDANLRGFRNLAQPQMQCLADMLFFDCALSVDEAKRITDFVKALLKWQPSSRQGAWAALKHEWLANTDKIKDIPLDECRPQADDVKPRTSSDKDASKVDWREHVADKIEAHERKERDMEIIAVDLRQQERKAQEEERHLRHMAAQEERKRKLEEKQAKQAAEEDVKKSLEEQRRKDEESKKMMDAERARKKKEELEERRRIDAEKKRIAKEQHGKKSEPVIAVSSSDPSSELLQDSAEKAVVVCPKTRSKSIVNDGCKQDKLSYAGLALSDYAIMNIYVSKDAFSASEVDFSQNQLSTQGMLRVAEICEQCKNLQILKLYKNNIDDNSVEAISSILKSCRKLREMHLSNNLLTNKGVASIIQVACEWRPESTVPLWLRLENNQTVCKGLLPLLTHEAVSVCPRLPRCSQFVCPYGAKLHVPFLFEHNDGFNLQECKSCEGEAERSQKRAQIAPQQQKEKRLEIISARTAGQDQVQDKDPSRGDKQKVEPIDVKQETSGECSVPGRSLQQLLVMTDQEIWRHAKEFIWKKASAAGKASDDKFVYAQAQKAWKSWIAERDHLLVVERLVKTGTKDSTTRCKYDGNGVADGGRTIKPIRGNSGGVVEATWQSKASGSKELSDTGNESILYIDSMHDAQELLMKQDLEAFADLERLVDGCSNKQYSDSSDAIETRLSSSAAPFVPKRIPESTNISPGPDTEVGVNAKASSEGVCDSEGDSPIAVQGNGQVVYYAIMSYNGEADGYLSVREGEFVLVKLWEPTPGDSGCKFQNYVYGQMLVDDSVGWLPIDVVSVSQWERFLDAGGVPWLYHAESATWKWQSQIHKPCRRWGVQREVGGEGFDAPSLLC